MEKYNLDKLVKVVVNDIYESRWYVFRTEKRFWGRITRKEGFYNWLNDGYIGMTAPKNHVIIDGKLYEKPEVVLCFQADYKKTIIFDTYQEAKDFAVNLTNDRKWLS